MKIPLLLLPLLAAVAAFPVLKESAGGSPAGRPGPAPLPAEVTINKDLLLKLVNDVRRKGCQCGDTYYYPVPEVTWNTQLEMAAYNHSSDMFQNKYFSHMAPDGSRGGDRIEKVGYRWTAYGENIGIGFRNERSVIEGWIKSPSHCKNIMNRLYREMGVARVGNYWTQELAAR